MRWRVGNCCRDQMSYFSRLLGSKIKVSGSLIFWPETDSLTKKNPISHNWNAKLFVGCIISLNWWDFLKFLFQSHTSPPFFQTGVHKSENVTYHGLALNCTDEPLFWFRHVVPCGLVGRNVTSLTTACARPVSVKEAVPLMCDALLDVLFGSTDSQTRTGLLDVSHCWDWHSEHWSGSAAALHGTNFMRTFSVNELINAVVTNVQQRGCWQPFQSLVLLVSNLINDSLLLSLCVEYRRFPVSKSTLQNADPISRSLSSFSAIRSENNRSPP